MSLNINNNKDILTITNCRDFYFVKINFCSFVWLKFPKKQNFMQSFQRYLLPDIKFNIMRAHWGKLQRLCNDYLQVIANTDVFRQT